MAPGSETWVLEYSRAPAHYATDASTLTDSKVRPADALLAGFLGDGHDEERARKRNGTKGEGGREWGREGGRDKGMSRASEVPQKSCAYLERYLPGEGQPAKLDTLYPAVTFRQVPSRTLSSDTALGR